MNKDYIKGLKIGLGITTILILFFGIVFAIGFHSANEILGGTFNGSFIFNDNVTFNGHVNGINSAGFTNLVGYDSPGNYNFTVPVGVSKIKITAAGAGGGGGGAGGTYGTKAPSGEATIITGTNVNIQANGGDGGYSRGAGGGSNGGNMGTATGGDINIAGFGAQGGGAGIVSYSETSLDGRNGGLAIQIVTVTPGENYTITVGAGGIGSTGAYGTGETGADGYAIIEY